MTLREYLDENKSKKDIVVLMFDKKNTIITNEYKRSEIKTMSKELLSKEYMDSNEEDDCIEIWVM